MRCEFSKPVSDARRETGEEISSSERLAIYGSVTSSCLWHEFKTMSALKGFRGFCLVFFLVMGVW